MNRLRILPACLAAPLFSARVCAQGADTPVDPHSFFTSTVNEAIHGVFQVALSGLLPSATIFLLMGAVVLLLLVGAHIWHREVKVTDRALVVLVVVLAAGLAYEWQHAPGSGARQKEPPAADAFIVRGTRLDLGEFTVALHDVDTLKIHPEEKTPEPWQWNITTFGEEGVRRFLEAAPPRLRAEFSEANEAFLVEWPTYARYQSILHSSNPEKEWEVLFKKKEGALQKVVVTSRRTGERTNLEDPFSKWPLARLSVLRKGESEPVVQGWYPENTVLQLLDRHGQSHNLAITAIFNGSRKIGEPEACVLELRMGKLRQSDRP